MVLETRPHWSYLGRAPFAVLLAVGVAVAVLVVWPKAPVALGWVLLGLVGLSALWTAGRLVRWRSTVLAVTTSRLVQRSGVLARRGVEVRLERVNEISYEQSLTQRLVGTGRLYLEVGGDRGVVGFDHVRRPQALAAVLQQQVDRRMAAGRRTTGPSGPGPDWSPTGAPGSWAPARGSPVRGSPVWGSPGDTPPRGTMPGPRGSLSEQLLELDDLRRRGIVSEEEYAERRTRLLDRL